uniref:ATP-dependent DNA helicase n=1 Tax=Fagus sylvatica TaxID=28930 RepID=A0A2N9H357_FAGSY
MDPGGLFTDLLKQLATIAAQQALQEIKLIVDVDEEFQKLQASFEMVQAMLDNAEERQQTDEAVKLWLDQLKDAYYMMDDVLDKWKTAMIKSKIQKAEEAAAGINTPALKKRKVWSFFPSPSCYFRQVDNLALRREIGHKIDTLNGTLDKILKDKVTYGIELSTKPLVVLERPKTTSVVDVSDIIGRDNYKDDLISNLLAEGSSEERKHRVISLVGMGGIGKSTLAQLAYNDPKVKAHFEQKMWVCVSEPFDQCRVAKAIIESVQGQYPNITELENLFEKICDLIRGKRFFLVLDDVWTEDSKKWEPFRDALKCGGQGSRILVTTRKNNVAEMMRSSLTINLEELSPNDCWLMFSKIAFSKEDQCKDLEDLGRQLVSKCKGLPLAIKTLVFPKDETFYKVELVLLWIAQGFIDSEENMEMKAEEYWEELANRSFFQDFEEYYVGISCKMHDIMHDFAQSRTKNECFTFHGEKEFMNVYEVKKRQFCKSARHLSLIVEETFPLELYEVTNLRSLNMEFSSSPHTVLPDLFQHLTCLRTLVLQGESIVKLPDETLSINLCMRLRKLPKGMGNKDDDEGSKLEYLKNLNHLRGTLAIRGLGNVVDVRDAENAQLNKKIHLRSLELHFLVEKNRRRMEAEIDVLVLNALEPHPELERLSILGNPGAKYPNWMMSLTKLKTLGLYFSITLQCLPPLGNLPSLETLTIRWMPNLKKVGVEFLGTESFPKLKSLFFSSLKEWKEWNGIGEMREEEEEADNGITLIRIMQRLHSLTIDNCPKLKWLPNFLRTTPLKELKIRDSPILSERVQREVWPKSQIQNIQIDGMFLQRDDNDSDSASIDSKMDDELMKWLRKMGLNMNQIRMKKWKQTMTRGIRGARQYRAIDMHRKRPIHLMRLGSKSKVLKKTKTLKMKKEEEIWMITLKVVAAGLPKIIDSVTLIGTLMDDDEDNEPGQEINDKDDVVEEDGIEYEADDDEDEEVEADNDEGDSRSSTDCTYSHLRAKRTSPSRPSPAASLATIQSKPIGEAQFILVKIDQQGCSSDNHVLHSDATMLGDDALFNIVNVACHGDQEEIRAGYVSCKLEIAHYDKCSWQFIPPPQKSHISAGSSTNSKSLQLTSEQFLLLLYHQELLLYQFLEIEDAECVNRPFVGKVVLVGGDFQQILPVVRKGRKEDIVYSVCGGEVSEMRKIMKYNKLRKEPGCSWIEVKDEVHTFLGGDMAHPRCKEIYKKNLDLASCDIAIGFVLYNLRVLRNLENTVMVFRKKQCASDGRPAGVGLADGAGEVEGRQSSVSQCSQEFVSP